MSVVRISILVAVYNAEKYIRKCLDSLVSQTFTDFEVVCVDDASTDGSAGIIAAYAANDKRIRLFGIKENSGQAKARNLGLQHCRGSIITFLDADDWLSEDALQTIILSFDNNPATDCVLFRCAIVYEDGREERYPGKNFSVESGREAFFDSLTWRIHGIYAAREALYRQCPFDDSCRCYSDDNTTRVHYYLSREVRQSEAVYYYRQHSQSATHGVSSMRMQRITASDNMRRILETLHCDDTILSVYETEHWKIIVDSYYFYYNNRRYFSKQDRQLCIAAIKKGWEDIKTGLLDKTLIHRPGYAPLRSSWLLFRLEEEVYFFLRRLFRRQ